jgi:hypothetical protein
MEVCTCHPSYTESLKKRVMVPAGLVINSRPYSRAAQVVEHLPSKCEAISSKKYCPKNQKSDTMIKLFSFQGCEDGSTYANQKM